jgi:succinoglycan biosynthesis transport protein ExoP
MHERELIEAPLRRVTIATREETADPRERLSATPPTSDWDAYVRAVANNRLLVIGITLLGTLLGIVAARRIEPQYAARAVLWIETRGAGVAGDVTGSGRLLEAPSWMDLLTSNAVLDSVVRSQRLYVTPASFGDALALREFEVTDAVRPGSYTFTPDPRGGRYTLADDEGVVERGTLGGPVGATLGFRWTPSAEAHARGLPIRFSVTAPHEATGRLAKEIKGNVDAGASFLRLELRGSDAARTTATLNAVAERVVSVAATMKKQRLAELERILSEQYRQAETDLRATERALSEFRVRALRRLEATQSTGATVRGEIEEVAALGADRDQLHRDRVRLESLLRTHGEGAVPLEALAAVRSVEPGSPLRVAIDEATRRDAEVRVLRYRYTDDAAPVVESLAALERLTKQEIPALVRTLIAELTAREAALAGRVGSAFDQLRSEPPLAIEEARLARRLEGAERVLGTVDESRQANRLALLSSLPDLHLLDEAREPRNPASELGPLLIVLSVVTSFGVSVAGARIRERYDSRVRTPDQVTRDLRLPILGCLPRVGWRQSGRGAQAAEEVIESLRGLRARLLNARSRSALCVTVTSPSSGDGKSFLSANLALSFAHAGFRTLLIDGDIRRGVQHRVLGASPRPGLVDVLAGEVEGTAAIQRTEYPALSFISAGTRSARGPELLAGSRLEAVLGSLRADFEVVIVDSPPLVAGVDALALASVTENLLLVLRSGMTDLPLAMAKLDAADAHPVRVIGAVLNDVQGQGPFRYYGYDLSGYLLSDELPPDARQPARVLGGRP